MNNRAFCTIVTFDYLPYAIALHYSYSRFHADDLFVLIADKEENELNLEQKERLRDLPSGIRLVYYNELFTVDLASDIYQKYWSGEMDNYRWSMKSVFMKYLLAARDIDKVIYADCDLFFFNDHQFLFNELEEFNILLTPHWRSSDPAKDSKNFDLLFVEGLYNGGFVAANSEARDVMEWWAKMCLYKCEKDFGKGQYVDQTHLNLMPVYFDKVKILKHKGCNVANWNLLECARQEVGGKILIDGKWDIIFIHFTKSTIRGILYGPDKKLKPYLEEHLNSLKSNGIEINLENYKGEKSSAPQRSRYWRAKNWLNKKIKGV